MPIAHRGNAQRAGLPANGSPKCDLNITWAGLSVLSATPYQTARVGCCSVDPVRPGRTAYWLYAMLGQLLHVYNRV